MQPSASRDRQVCQAENGISKGWCVKRLGSNGSVVGIYHCCKRSRKERGKSDIESEDLTWSCLNRIKGFEILHQRLSSPWSIFNRDIWLQAKFRLAHCPMPRAKISEPLAPNYSRGDSYITITFPPAVIKTTAATELAQRPRLLPFCGRCSMSTFF